jgi:hypothetical protein
MSAASKAKASMIININTVVAPDTFIQSEVMIENDSQQPVGGFNM